jgi:hypothetical protein
MSAAVPTVEFVAESTNVTVPDGVPELGATAPTVAVRVTVCPNTDGLADDVRTTEVFALVMASGSDAAWGLLKLASPL